MILSTILLPLPFFRLMNDDYIPSKNLSNGPFKSGFMFLLRLAWQSRLRLPALVFLVYILFDIRIQFEMNIHPPREAIEDEMAGDEFVRIPDYYTTTDDDDDDEDEDEEDEYTIEIDDDDDEIVENEESHKVTSS